MKLSKRLIIYLTMENNENKTGEKVVTEIKECINAIMDCINDTIKKDQVVNKQCDPC